MTTILLENDTIPTQDLMNCLTILNKQLKIWGNAWGIDAVAVLATAKPDMIVNITDKNRHVGAYGYHTVENGVPISYCSPRAISRIYGHYTPAFYTKQLKVLGKVIRPAKLIHGELVTQGLITVILHETFEMLADAHIDKLSKPDSKGRTWLIEVCDHTSGQYSVDTVNGNVYVIPNSTLPSYYDLKGKAPYDLLGKLKTPFDQSAVHFYGYWKDANGKLVKL